IRTPDPKWFSPNFKYCLEQLPKTWTEPQLAILRPSGPRPQTLNLTRLNHVCGFPAPEPLKAKPFSIN
ncbi:hypothetical protein AMECASPLE_038182, partial [Ameca splendens]